MVYGHFHLILTIRTIFLTTHGLRQTSPGFFGFVFVVFSSWKRSFCHCAFSYFVHTARGRLLQYSLWKYHRHSVSVSCQMSHFLWYCVAVNSSDFSDNKDVCFTANDPLLVWIARLGTMSLSTSSLPGISFPSVGLIKLMVAEILFYLTSQHHSINFPPWYALSIIGI